MLRQAHLTLRLFRTLDIGVYGLVSLARLSREGESLVNLLVQLVWLITSKPGCKLHSMWDSQNCVVGAMGGV